MCSGQSAREVLSDPHKSCENMQAKSRCAAEYELSSPLKYGAMYWQRAWDAASAWGTVNRIVARVLMPFCSSWWQARIDSGVDGILMQTRDLERGWAAR